MTTSKHITISDDLAEYVERTNLNLSWFVQKKLREKMIGNNIHLVNHKNITIALATSNANEWAVFGDSEIVYKKDLMLHIIYEHPIYWMDEEDLNKENITELEKLSMHLKKERFDYPDIDERKKNTHPLTNWAIDFPDPKFGIGSIVILYGTSRLKKFYVVSCDGGRYLYTQPHMPGNSFEYNRDEMYECSVVFSPLEWNVSIILTSKIGYGGSIRQFERFIIQ